MIRSLQNKHIVMNTKMKNKSLWNKLNQKLMKKIITANLKTKIYLLINCLNKTKIKHIKLKNKKLFKFKQKNKNNLILFQKLIKIITKKNNQLKKLIKIKLKQNNQFKK